MKPINRRKFIKSATTAGGVLAASACGIFAVPAFIKYFVKKAQMTG